MNPQVKEISREDPRIVCQYCNKSTVNSLEWGPLYSLAGVTVHYFCMLFSAGLSQNGEDDDGILGFLPIDIRKELKRGEKLKCKFCKLPRATIGCSVKTCKSSYHYPCGLLNGCVFHFIGNYESYCRQHKEVTEIPLPMEEWECPICFSNIDKDDDVPLWPPCCKKKVFHKRCIMEMAKNHGAHFFKCPLCNDKEVFSEAMRKAGVYLPDRDAAWETEPNAFVEHTRLYNKCDAETCECPRGREFTQKSDNKPWKVVRCGACGAAGIHKRCGGLRNLTWRCQTCADILTDRRRNESINSSRIQRRQFDLSEEDVNGNSSYVTAHDVIQEIPQLETSSSGDSSSDEEPIRTPVRRPIVMDPFSRPVREDSSDDDDSTDNSDSDDESDRGSNTPPKIDILVQPNSRIAKLVAEQYNSQKRIPVSNTFLPATPKSKPTGLRNFLRSSTDKAKDVHFGQENIRGVLEDMNNVDHSSLRKSKWKEQRVSALKAKLNNIVKCCRQSSNTSTSGNVSNPVRITESVKAVQCEPVVRSRVVMPDSRKSVQEKVVISQPEVIKESEKSIVFSSPKSQAIDSKIRTCSPKPNISEDLEVLEVQDEEVSTNRRDASCITLSSSSDSDGSEIEIVSETANPKPIAFLRLLNVRNMKHKPTMIRLGVDDHENDDLVVDNEVLAHKSNVDFSSYSHRPDQPAVASIFLKTINDCSQRKRPKKRSFTAFIRSETTRKMTETIDIVISDDDDEPGTGTRLGNSNQCSKETERLIEQRPSSALALQSKKPRI